MADEDDASKTEDPTEKKLQDARGKGQVAQSQEVKSWAVLLGGTAGLIFLAPFMANSVRTISRTFIESPHTIPSDFDHLRRVFADLSIEIGMVLAPLFLLLVVLAFASNVGQFGLIWSVEKISPDLKKISLLAGVKRMFSSRTIIEFLKGIAKLVIVGVVAFGLALPLLADLELISQMDFIYSLDRIHTIAIYLAAGTVAVMTVIAGLDLVYQKMKHAKEMRMSKQEVKDEHKQSEGDPQIKARIRQIRADRAQNRMMASVPDADVIITNPTHYSVALQYKMEEMSAPKVVAKGVDHLAFRIREMAEDNDIPIVENPPLARALYASVEIDEEIPAEHFTAVAEVIGYVMRMRGQLN
ncbi:MAG: flagellar biosynthesis protein FlhB [Rhodospirillales bacterium]|nr:flagellar biosynthesis protein FlhB [Rhodospirillales bacterium]